MGKFFSTIRSLFADGGRPGANNESAASDEEASDRQERPIGRSVR